MDEEREIILIIFFLLTSSVNSDLLYGDCKRTGETFFSAVRSILSEFGVVSCTKR